MPSLKIVISYYIRVYLQVVVVLHDQADEHGAEVGHQLGHQVGHQLGTDWQRYTFHILDAPRSLYKNTICKSMVPEAYHGEV